MTESWASRPDVEVGALAGRRSHDGEPFISDAQYARHDRAKPFRIAVDGDPSLRGRLDVRDPSRGFRKPQPEGSQHIGDVFAQGFDVGLVSVHEHHSHRLRRAGLMALG